MFAVAAVVLAAALPFGRAFVDQQRVRALSGEIGRTLVHARAQAITHGRAVSVCGRSAPGATACAADAEGWRRGWLVFWGGAGATPSAATLIASVERAQGSIVLDGPATPVVFYPNGRATPASDKLFVVACRARGDDGPVLFRSLQLRANGYLNTVIEQDAPDAC
ncbi:hypothetical protein AVW16_03500 [Crenobacter luteus]|uniref:Type II secretion system protein H n=1 Tax=Crenobacter luteus TaxID=1452487 RepID=A0A161SB84_9NEIS|nr:hypothetical protein AVW16_03500 [Crenobacter luteus]